MKEHFEPHSAEELKKEASRTVSDAELIKGGAEYKQGRKFDGGPYLPPRLELTSEQIKKISEDSLPEIIPKDEDKKEKSPDQVQSGPENAKEKGERHEFKVLGSLWMGKKNPRADFTLNDMNGELPQKAKTDPDFDISKYSEEQQKQVLYRKKLGTLLEGGMASGGRFSLVYNGAMRESYFTRPGITDASGRPGSDLFAITTSGNVNPVEQMITMIDPKFEKKSFMPGEVVETKTAEDILDKSIENITDQNVNEILSKLIFGEIVYIKASTLLALNKKGGLVAKLPLLACGNNAVDLKNFSDPKKEDPVLYTILKGPMGINSRDAENFAKLVLGKFGEKDAHLELLFETVKSPEIRRNVLKAFSENNIPALDLEESNALEWIKMVGSPEEIKQAEKILKK